MESLVGYGSDSENSEIGTPNRHKLQANQVPLPVTNMENVDAAAANAAQLQAEWESFAELIGDSALQGPMPVDIMSIPLPDGIPFPTAAPELPPVAMPTCQNEAEQQDEAVPMKDGHSSSNESERSRSKSRSRSRSRSSSRSSSSSSSGSESDDSSGPSTSKKKKSTDAADCSTIIPENIPMPDATSPSSMTSPTERIRNDSITSEKSTYSKKDIASSNEDDTKMSRKDRRRRPDLSRSHDRKRRSRSRDRRRRRRRSGSRSRDKRRRRSRDRKRSRSPRKLRSRDRKFKRRSRSRSRDRKHRRRRSRSRSPRRRSRSRDRRRRSRDMGGKPQEGAMKNRNLTFKEQLKKSFIEAQREIEKTGTCSLDLGSDSTEYKHNEKPSNLPLYDNPLLAVTGGTDPTKLLPTSNSTPQLAFLQTMQAMHKKAQELTGVSVPKYYNPAAVNPLKYAEQVQKRKLLWSKKETKEVGETPTQNSAQWQSSVFSQDQDGKVSAKFRKLMGIKGDETDADETEEKKKRQQEMFQRLDQEYAMARMATHTHRGIGLGFNSMGQPIMSNPGAATGTSQSSATGAGSTSKT